MLFFLSRLEQRRAREADEHGVRQDRLHGVVQGPRLGPVALVHEDVQVAFGTETGRQGFSDFLDIGRNIPDLLAVLLRRTCGPTSKATTV